MEIEINAEFFKFSFQKKERSRLLFTKNYLRASYDHYSLSLDLLSDNYIEKRLQILANKCLDALEMEQHTLKIVNNCLT